MLNYYNCISTLHQHSQYMWVFVCFFLTYNNFGLEQNLGVGMFEAGEKLMIHILQDHDNKSQT